MPVNDNSRFVKVGICVDCKLTCPAGLNLCQVCYENRAVAKSKADTVPDDILRELVRLEIESRNDGDKLLDLCRLMRDNCRNICSELLARRAAEKGEQP